ncbi:carbon starvation CstA family protein [Symbiobacterium thermophilum]|uniref:Carbon starvation-induced protein n=2 Tax=Symbiobacterium thermophilum TaxID=2734 RepID=Q67RM5_SYMTH|nr:carbon starvation CstA family protein [Symbiobacterium thermophilum]BAD39668.1 carbon starvation-induced protein [Symbiobacterium thermophilum IAM 14863]
MSSPALFVLLALVAYGIAYFGYGKWFDRNVWKPDPKRTTPAHMYTDGVEYFPVSKYVLWGYQFKSVAALGPILGPYIAIQYGWAPALAWIILGNFFIGWLQDYGAIMLSIRNQGRSFGPITYEFTGNTGRNTLLGFILFYLLIISATFIYFIALFWHTFPSTFAATVGILLVGVLAGQMLYKMRANVVTATALSIVLMALVIWAAASFPFLQTPQGAWPPNPAQGVEAGGIAGPWSLLIWCIVACVVLYLASVLPLPTFIQPVNYVSFFPTFLAVILILIGALVSNFTGVRLEQPAWIGFNPTGNNPMWPLMFVAIACGSISGWHSLVSSSSTAKQLDIETDAHPVGAGAMLSEGLLALASLAAYMIIPREQLTGNVGSWVAGAIKFTAPFLGGEAAVGFLRAYFGVCLILYALTVQALVTRFWRLVSTEVFQGRLAILGQKHVATFIGLLIPLAFAATGSWNNLWLYFGGSNQLLAGLALMLITIHLARVQAPTVYTLIPATFMMVTTITAIGWQVVKVYLPAFLGTTPTLVQYPFNQYPGFSRAMDGIFVLVGVALFVLGLVMAYKTYSAYAEARRGLGSSPRVATSGD